jgi:acyl carrier protein
MSTKDSIRQYIREEIVVPEGAEIADDTPLWGGVLDSVALMQLITFVEEQFGVEVADDELTSAHFGTVADIAMLVDEKKAAIA